MSRSHFLSGAARDEDCGGRVGLCGPGAGRVPGGNRERRHLYRQGCGEGPHPAPGHHAHLRARPRRDGQAQPGGEAAGVHDRPAPFGSRGEHRVHRGWHAAARRRVGRPDARARRRARNRESDERLQSHRRQEHGAGRHGAAGARDCRQGNLASLQRGQQSGVPEAGRRGRGLPETRSRGHWRRRRSRPEVDDRPLRALHAHGRAHHGHGYGERRDVQVRGELDPGHAHLVHERDRERLRGVRRQRGSGAQGHRRRSPHRVVSSCFRGSVSAAAASRRTSRRSSSSPATPATTSRS